MMNKIEKFKPVVITGLLAGLSIKTISGLLRQNHGLRVKPHQLSVFVSKNREEWAKELLNNTLNQEQLITAIQEKKIKRKRSSGTSIPVNCYASVLAIASSSYSYSESLPQVNQFLNSQEVKPISYHQLCRLIRKMKGGI
jgi:hypothetical protein